MYHVYITVEDLAAAFAKARYLLNDYTSILDFELIDYVLGDELYRFRKFKESLNCFYILVKNN